MDKSLLYICADQFSPLDASVYCYEVTGTDYIEISSAPLEDEPIQLPIYEYNYNCNGTESSLCECPTTELEQCGSNSVSEVKCKAPSKYILLT